ncbi:U2-type spliceosomal complex subunit [Maudiozyma humilis]|uniref:Pre-mRNA-splicing factor CWC21 n=1 Tax=Maudiozyma humilis TaxID=51915 RepID=A0AAV5RXW7_MAUHU|nr:U2-type spliceosomal complex subunit [Kazachstania humilis]
MSYNGIGLPSAKGSATSGHVQRSLARPPRATNTKISKNTHARRAHTPDASVRAHARAREVELRVAQLRDTLEDEQDRGSDITDAEIDARCDTLRRELREAQTHSSEERSHSEVTTQSPSGVTAYRARDKRTTAPPQKSGDASPSPSRASPRPSAPTSRAAPAESRDK